MYMYHPLEIYLCICVSVCLAGCPAVRSEQSRRRQIVIVTMSVCVLAMNNLLSVKNAVKYNSKTSKNSCPMITRSKTQRPI